MSCQSLADVARSKLRWDCFTDLSHLQASAHTLRHTFAHNYLTEHPGDVVGLATLLGHTSLDTTRLYSQPTIEQLAIRVEGLRQNAYGE